VGEATDTRRTAAWCLQTMPMLPIIGQVDNLWFTPSVKAPAQLCWVTFSFGELDSAWKMLPAEASTGECAGVACDHAHTAA